MKFTKNVQLKSHKKQRLCFQYNIAPSNQILIFWQQLYTMLTELNQIMSARKQNMHTANRKDDLKGRLRMMRTSLIKTYNQKLLETIQNSNNDLTHSVLLELIEYAHRDEQNAIMQLGNLLIDNRELAHTISCSVFPKNNEYWAWLIRLLVVCKEFNQNMYEYLLTRIIYNRNYSTLCLSNSLESLNQLTKNQTFSGVLLQNNAAIIAVARLTQSTRQQLYRPAFKILANLVSFNESFTLRLYLLLQDDLEKVIKMGLLKVQHEIKLLASQTLANIAINIPLGRNFIQLVVSKAKKQKNSIMKELSYYFVNLMISIPLTELYQLFQQHLTDVLHKYFESENPVLVANACQILTSVLIRLRQLKDEKSFIEYIGYLKQENLLTYMMQHHQLEDLSIEEFVIKMASS